MTSVGAVNSGIIVNTNNQNIKENKKVEEVKTSSFSDLNLNIFRANSTSSVNFGEIGRMVESAKSSIYSFLSDFPGGSENTTPVSTGFSMGKITTGMTSIMDTLLFPITKAYNTLGNISFSNPKPPVNQIKMPTTLKAEGVTIPSVSTSVNGVNIYVEPKGLLQIMRCESYIPPPGKNIKDGAGITVGYGHTGGGVKIRNKQDAVNVLAKDIKASIDDKFRMIPKEVLRSLNQDQINALASAAMNMSSKGFRNFGPVKALLEHNKGIEERIADAGYEFMSKLRKGFSGLVWRRATEALTFAGTYVQNPGKDAVHTARSQDLVG